MRTGWSQTSLGASELVDPHVPPSANLNYQGQNCALSFKSLRRKNLILQLPMPKASLSRKYYLNYIVA